MKHIGINYASFIVIILNLILFSQFIKCFNRKIELAEHYIKLKVKGDGYINIYSKFYRGIKPNIVNINNIINLTDSQVDNIRYFNCLENTINNITLIWNEPLGSINSLFQRCNNITEIDLSHFDTSQVTDMRSMFDSCSSLISLNLDNFDTSKVENMGNMFTLCSALTSLNLSSFDTKRVSHMGVMFGGCSSLKSLDLSNFNTSSVTVMENMFRFCSSLTSLNLINFNTSSVSYMLYMFYGCSLLSSLDLSNFDTS